MNRFFFLAVTTATVLVSMIMPLISCTGPTIAPTTTSTLTPEPYTAQPSREARAPWLDMPTYVDPGQAVVVSAGDRFCIGLHVTPRLGEHWVVAYDDNALSNVDRELVLLDPMFPVDGTDWFLFSALKRGDTEVSFELVSATNQVRVRTSFDIKIR